MYAISSLLSVSFLGINLLNGLLVKRRRSNAPAATILSISNVLSAERAHCDCKSEFIPAVNWSVSICSFWYWFWRICNAASVVPVPPARLSRLLPSGLLGLSSAGSANHFRRINDLSWILSVGLTLIPKRLTIVMLVSCLCANIFWSQVYPASSPTDT